MGLDITAYRKLKKLDVVFDADGKPLAGSVGVWASRDFPGREEGLEDGAAYAYEETDEVLSMGYISYNRWREQLAQLAGYPTTRIHRHGIEEYTCAAACWMGATGPFSELINFADNEGVIGPVVAAKLARDFAEWDGKAGLIGGRFYETYCDLRRGCDMAADGGMLDFS